MNKTNYWLTLLFILAMACSDKEDDNDSGKYAGKTFASEKLTYGVDTLAADLKNPWGIAFLPDGRMLVTERAGEVLIFQDDKLLADRI